MDNTTNSFEVHEEDSSSSKVDFVSNVFRQIERINFCASHLNETPPYVWMAYAKSEMNKTPESIKPNRDNFFYAVYVLDLIMCPYRDPEYKKAIERYEKELKEAKKNDKPLNKVEKGFKKYEIVIQLVWRKGFYPTQEWE